MAKPTLPTNYVDDVLNESMDGKRRYNMIPNADGSTSLEDVTAYDQVGSNFGASNLNTMNQAINDSFDKNKMLKTKSELNAVTQEGYGVDATLVKEVNNTLGGITQFIVDNSTGQITGYKTEIGGADTVFPFKSGGVKLLPSIRYVKNADTSNGQFFMTYDVSELTKVSYESSVSGNSTARYSLDGGTLINMPATSGVIDVSSATTLLITVTANSTTERTLVITDYE